MPPRSKARFIKDITPGESSDSTMLSSDSSRYLATDEDEWSEEDMFKADDSDSHEGEGNAVPGSEDEEDEEPEEVDENDKREYEVGESA